MATSQTRRAGSKIAKFLASLLDPASIAGVVQQYSKTVDAIAQLFTIDSSGAIYQMTPPGIVGGAVITPASLGAGTTNDYAPAGLRSATLIRQGMTGANTLTGLDATAAGGAGRRITIVNINTTIANQLTLANESASSAAANRFSMPGAANFPLPPSSAITLEYDATSSRWRPVSMATTWVPDVIITPTTIAANQNNWSPTGLAGATVIRIGYGAGFEITGMAAQPAGTEITIQSIRSTASPEYLTFRNENASSTAANRFALPQGNSWYLPPNASFVFKYDGTLSRWVLKSFATNSFPESNAVGGPGLNVGYPVENIGLRRESSQVIGMLAGAVARQSWDGASPDPRANFVPNVSYFENRGQLRWSGVAAIGPLTGTVNNQTLADTTLTMRTTTSAITTLTGLTGGAAGRVVTIINASANNIVINSEDAGSTAANRFLLSAASLTILPEGVVQFWYDTTSSRWRRLGG